MSRRRRQKRRRRQTVSWEKLEELCAGCTRCGLCRARNSVVFGGGSRNARIMLVGEAPGKTEDLQGKVFVGPAGQLLDRMLASIGLSRESVYLTNIVKCRPPSNRDPSRAECEACLPYLREETAHVRPDIIVCLGRTAAQTVIRPDFRITAEHGSWTERGGCFLTATFHPAALLRYPENKRAAYGDLLSVREKLDGLEKKRPETPETYKGTE